MLHAREEEGLLEHQVRLGERVVGVAARVAEAMADVRAGLGLERREIGEVAGERLARVDERRAGRQRLLERDHGGQRRVVDLDQLERLGGGRFVDRDHRGHRIALVAGDVHGEHRAVAERGAVERLDPAREIGAGEHRQHARVRAGAARIDAIDPRVRVGRAQHLRVRHARHREVGDVARAPGDLLGGVDARDRLPDHAQRRHSGGLRLRRRRAATGGGADRVEDLAIAGAAAQAAAQVVEDVLLARRGVLVEQRLRREQHPRGAEAALHGAAVDERLRDRAREAFDRLHRAALGLDRQVRARADGEAVHQDRARAADLGVARALGALQVEAVAEDVEQQGVRRHVELVRAAVDDELHATTVCG